MSRRWSLATSIRAEGFSWPISLHCAPFEVASIPKPLSPPVMRAARNDAGAAAIVTTAANAERLGLRPFAKLVSWGVAGVEPNRMGIGPVPAVAKALSRVDLSLDRIDLIEVNEAFAAQVLACAKAWGLSAQDIEERFNVNGSGISLGHPVGATGGRILANLLRELDRRQGRYGIETMCIGGGQGIAAVFENLRR